MRQKSLRTIAWIVFLFLPALSGVHHCSFARKDIMRKPLVQDDDAFLSSEVHDYEQVDPKPNLESPVQPGPIEHLKPLPPFGAPHKPAPPPPAEGSTVPISVPQSPPSSSTVPISVPSSSPGASGSSTIVNAKPPNPHR